MIYFVSFLIFLIWLAGSAVAAYHLIVHYEPKSQMKTGLNLYIWLSVITIMINIVFLVF